MDDVFERPFRLRVLDALTACLQQITVANGYKHDLQENVYRGRIVYGESDPLPLVSILETPLPIDQVTSPETSVESTGEWDLLIQGFVKDDPMNPTDPAYFLVSDVIKALANERKRGGREMNILGMKGLVDKINIGSPVCRPSDDISATSYFWLRITLKIIEDIADPYGSINPNT